MKNRKRLLKSIRDNIYRQNEKRLVQFTTVSLPILTYKSTQITGINIDEYVKKELSEEIASQLYNDGMFNFETEEFTTEYYSKGRKITAILKIVPPR